MGGELAFLHFAWMRWIGEQIDAGDQVSAPLREDGGVKCCFCRLGKSEIIEEVLHILLERRIAHLASDDAIIPAEQGPRLFPFFLKGPANAPCDDHRPACSVTFSVDQGGIWHR